MKARLKIQMALLVTTAVVYWLDISAGKELNLWVLYVIPVIGASFACGMLCGLIWSVIATALLIIDGLVIGHTFSSDLILVINRLVCGAGLVTVSILSTGLRAAFFDYFESRDHS